MREYLHKTQISKLIFDFHEELSDEFEAVKVLILQMKRAKVILFQNVLSLEQILAIWGHCDALFAQVR